MTETVTSEDSETVTSVPTKSDVPKVTSPLAFQKKDVKTSIQIKKASSIPVIERRNWLIHLHYTRKEFTTCKSIIKEQLKETKGQCEYAIYIQAMILRNEGEIQSSLELFQACHSLDPKNPENLKQVAKNLVLLGKHKSAIECYNKAGDLGVRDWNLCYCLGICHQFLKDKDAAVRCFSEALGRRKHVEVFLALSQLHIENDEKEKAMEVLKQGTEYAPENVDILTSLGLLHLEKEDYHRAFELLGQVLTYDPENYKAILAVSSLMQHHDDYDVALNKYRVAAQCVPESSSVWNNVGMCYFGKKKTIPAVGCLKRAHYFAPFDWKILYNLSLVHLSTQQYVSAFHFASAGIAMSPQQSSLFTLLAISLSNLGQNENAAQAYEQSYDRSCKDIYFMLNYCIFLHNNSENRKAVKIMSKINTDFNMEELRKSDKQAFEMCKRLNAALQVGDRVVAAVAKTPKPSPFDLTSTEVASSVSVLKSEEKVEPNTPKPSSRSDIQTPRKKLSAILPPLGRSLDVKNQSLKSLFSKKEED